MVSAKWAVVVREGIMIEMGLKVGFEEWRGLER